MTPNVAEARHEGSGDAMSRTDRSRRIFYWLAGARWETLRLCPPSERERIAVLGSTVLIPTVMAFFGMFFYARSRFAEPQPLLCLIGSVAWAFVIMNTDRILLATYRPFQAFWRRMMQVCFRFGLAAVVSVAIAFPFCLDQYRPAITHRYQTEIQGVLNQLREEESAGRKEMVSAYDTEHAAKLDAAAEMEKGIINFELYADGKIEEEKKRITAVGFVPAATPATRQWIAQIEAQTATLAKVRADHKDAEDLHRRLVEAIAREVAGQPNEFFPEPKKAGEGPRTKDMQRRNQEVTTLSARLLGTVRALTDSLAALDKQLADARLADRNALLDALPDRRQAYVAEGQEMERVRQERLTTLRREITSHTADHERALRLHDDRFLPPIQRYENKIKGVLDPMEETIGLYKVIFLTAPDATVEEQGGQGFKWVAGLFQFLVIFGTLFVLDLVPIMAKIFSRPGPYDVLVDQAELVAGLNLQAFQKAYPGHAGRWAAAGHTPVPGDVLRAQLSRADGT